MQRSKRILLISHCIINQNTVIEGEARALGAIPSALEWINEEGVGVLQLPCPEFTFLGLERPSMTYAQYDNDEYRAHCREILMPTIEQIEEYVRCKFEVIGVLGIQSSPSCDPSRGVFMEELHSLLAEKNIFLNTNWFLPNDENPEFDSAEHFIEKSN